MNIKQLVYSMLMLAILSPAYAVDKLIGIGTITDLKLHKNEIFIDGKSYKLDSTIKVYLPDKDKLISKFQLTNNMSIDFSYKNHPKDTKKIYEIWLIGAP